MHATLSLLEPAIYQYKIKIILGELEGNHVLVRMAGTDRPITATSMEVLRPQPTLTWERTGLIRTGSTREDTGESSPMVIFPSNLNDLQTTWNVAICTIFRPLRRSVMVLPVGCSSPWKETAWWAACYKNTIMKNLWKYKKQQNDSEAQPKHQQQIQHRKINTPPIYHSPSGHFRGSVCECDVYKTGDSRQKNRHTKQHFNISIFTVRQMFTLLHMLFKYFFRCNFGEKLILISHSSVNLVNKYICVLIIPSVIKT